MKIGTLFSGIGAPEFALKSLKIPYSVEFACDNDPYVRQAYLKNHKCKKFYDDINDIKKVPKVDILVLGFPCQPYSSAGNQLGLKDPRGKLVLKALDIIKQSKPKTFIAENVAGLQTLDNGKTLKYIVNKMKKMGYFVKYKTMNSLDCGIPQNRNRLWIVGTKNKGFNFSTKKISYKPLSSFLDRKTDDKVYASKNFLKKQKVINRMRNYKNDFINCITQTISRNGSSSEYISYISAMNKAIGQKRKPTVNECRKLFGFPKEFVFPESICTTRRYNMFANSMVVPEVKNIMKQIMKGILWDRKQRI